MNLAPRDFLECALMIVDDHCRWCVEVCPVQCEIKVYTCDWPHESFDALICAWLGNYISGCLDAALLSLRHELPLLLWLSAGWRRIGRQKKWGWAIDHLVSNLDLLVNIWSISSDSLSIRQHFERTLARMFPNTAMRFRLSFPHLQIKIDDLQLFF